MKIWYGYGSEHSARLVMIGEFKTEEDADRVHELLKKVMRIADDEYANGNIRDWSLNEKFSKATEKRLSQLDLPGVSPHDVADFAMVRPSIEQTANALRLFTDESDIGGYVKLLASQGAKVQVYSWNFFSDDSE